MNDGADECVDVFIYRFRQCFERKSLGKGKNRETDHDGWLVQCNVDKMRKMDKEKENRGCPTNRSTTAVAAARVCVFHVVSISPLGRLQGAVMTP